MLASILCVIVIKRPICLLIIIIIIIIIIISSVVERNHTTVARKWQTMFWPTLSIAQRRTPHRPLLDLGEEDRLSYHKKSRGIEGE